MNYLEPMRMCPECRQTDVMNRLGSCRPCWNRGHDVKMMTVEEFEESAQRWDAQGRGDVAKNRRKSAQLLLAKIKEEAARCATE